MKIDGTRRQDRAVELVLGYYAAFNRGDREAMLALLADDVVHDLNQGARETGKAAFAAFMPSTAVRCSTMPSRADDQVMAIGTFRVRSISSMTASETFRFWSLRRAPSKPGLAISWAAAALISGE